MRYDFDYYSNGFYAYGFRKYEHFKAKVILSRVYKYRMTSWVTSVDWNEADATSAGTARAEYPRNA